MDLEKIKNALYFGNEILEESENKNYKKIKRGKK